ncbi:hypothetical protein MLD38_013813 [Melastoma candidum]|uniref:Uncharacterized protein n=1 Tax=Melastoma candidum TaxID=119954 RepID=A0ACB9RBY0_9MYRT|nr:hypothetical protein MLD38_013813 [Melastoma candidum]
MAQLPKLYDFLLPICLACLFFCNTIGAAAVPPPASPQPSHHFVLVHGAAHGAWCWFEIITLLRSSGQRVTALDMAASGIDPQEANNIRSVADYFQPLADFIVALPSTERVILVGHSYGGIGLTYSMELFPQKIAVAIFVTAVMPGPTLDVSVVNQAVSMSLQSMLDSTYSYNNGSNNPPTSVLVGPTTLATKVYQLSPVDDIVLATLLVRRFPLFTEENLSDVIRPTKERYGRVKRVYIMSGQDQVLKVDFQEKMIRGNPPDEVLKVNDSDHMVMFSKPTELSELLLRIAGQYS